MFDNFKLVNQSSHYHLYVDDSKRSYNGYYLGIRVNLISGEKVFCMVSKTMVNGKPMFRVEDIMSRVVNKVKTR